MNSPLMLIIGPHAAKLHWVAPGTAKLYFPTWFQANNVEDLLSIPLALQFKLIKDFDAHKLEDLWPKLEKNVTIYAPGDFYHEMVPAKLPRRPARLTQHATYVLHMNASKFVGPLQGRLIAIHLYNIFKSNPFTDQDAQRVLDTPAFLRNWKGKQIPFKVFNWYRPWFIEGGIMKIIPGTAVLAKLNDISSTELRRLKPTKKKK